MENKQMDKRYQKTNDKSTQKTTNGFKNTPKTDQQKLNADILKSNPDPSFDSKDKSVNRPGSKTDSDWNSKNQANEQSDRPDHDYPMHETNQNQYSEKALENRSAQRNISLNPNEDPQQNQQTGKKQTSTDQRNWHGKDKNHPDKNSQIKSSPGIQYDKNHNKDTEHAGVIDEDRGLFYNEEMDFPTRDRSFGESFENEPSSSNTPKKKNQAPTSKFS